MFRKILNTLGLCLKEEFDQEQALRIHLEKKLKEGQEKEKYLQKIISARLLEQHIIFEDKAGGRSIYIPPVTIQEADKYQLSIKKDLQNRLIIKITPKCSEK